MLADNFFNLIQSKWAFLLILNGFLLVVGMFVDMTPALIMLVPMLIPLAQKFGIDMVHLGLIMVINLAFGLTTPPVGTALFVALKVGNISMEKIIPPLHPAAGLHVRGAAVRHLRARGLPVAAARTGADEVTTGVPSKGRFESNTHPLSLTLGEPSSAQPSAGRHLALARPLGVTNGQSPKGRKSRELPIEQTTMLELIVNVQDGKAPGIAAAKISSGGKASRLAPLKARRVRSACRGHFRSYPNGALPAGLV